MKYPRLCRGIFIHAYRQVSAGIGCVGIGNLTIDFSLYPVGETSACALYQPRNWKAMVGRSKLVLGLQVPPRAPERQSKDCLFFCQSMVDKTGKNGCNLHFWVEMEIFRLCLLVLAHCHLFLPNAFYFGGDPSARRRNRPCNRVLSSCKYILLS